MNSLLEPQPLRLSEAVARLTSIRALEEFSAIAGVRALVVDLSEPEPELDAAALSAAGDRMSMLACPTIAIVPPTSASTASAIQRRFDMLVESDEQLAVVLAAVARRPLAATALVQLLRHGEGLSLHEALVAESFVYSTLQAGPEFTEWLGGQKTRSALAVSDEPAVLVRRDRARLEIVLNRPERRNAYSAEMRDALVEALTVAVSDPTIAELVVSGRGPAFSAGGDLLEFGSHPDPATSHLVRSTRNAARLLALCANRTRVELHGACVGAGIELPAFASRLVARKNALFELPEVGMGLIPGAGGTASIPRRIGRQRTAYLAVTGVRLDAEAALEWGLIDEIVA